MKKKKTPLRKCVITGEMRPKQELIRIVRNKEKEVFVDPSGKKNGRGAYLTLKSDIIKRAKETNVLSEQLKVTIPEQIYDDLFKLLEEKENAK